MSARSNRSVAAVAAGLLLAVSLFVPPAHGAAATGQIVGTLRDAGRPVAGATVDAAPADEPWAAAGTTSLTDAAGRFQVTDLPAGRWLLRTVLPGGWLTQFYPATTDTANTAVPLTVLAGQATRVEETVLPHASIEGQVTFNNGAPAAGAYVTTPHRLTIQARTDESGHYLLDYLTPGDHAFAVRAGDYAPVQWIPRSNTPQTFSLAAGQRLHLDERLLPLGRITGRYTGSTGPISATVTAHAGDTTAVQALTAEPDGTFTLWVSPGDYTLRFDSVNDNRDQWATGALTESAAQVFTVREDQIVRHDERTVPAGTLRGRVLNYAGVPFDKPSQVVLYDSAGWIRAQVDTDSAGTWSVQVAPDTYKVQLSNGYYQYSHDKVTVDDADAYTVESGRTTTVPDELMRPHTDLFVYATLSGTPVQAFCATLTTAGTDRVCTDNGEAWFSDVYPGDYQVTIEAPGRPPATGTATLVDREYVTVTVPL